MYLHAWQGYSTETVGFANVFDHLIAHGHKPHVVFRMGSSNPFAIVFLLNTTHTCIHVVGRSVGREKATVVSDELIEGSLTCQENSVGFCSLEFFVDELRAVLSGTVELTWVCTVTFDHTGQKE